MDKFGYRLLLWTSRVIGALPVWFLYNVLLCILYFLLYRVARYRVRVVRENLSSSFPEKDRKELRRIEREYYRHLAELFIDTIDLAGISEKQMRKRMVFEDLEDHLAETDGKNWIAGLSHYGAWEYFISYQLHTGTQIVGVYKALHNKGVDMYYNHMRSRFGMLPVDRKNILRHMVAAMKDTESNTALGLIADQYVRGKGMTLDSDFLNHKTMFFSGIEKMSARFGIPVYYVDVRKLKRAHYSAKFRLIYDGKEQLPEGEVTRRYAESLEATIRRDPPYWMWSHKRWKQRSVETTEEDGAAE